LGGVATDLDVAGADRVRQLRVPKDDAVQRAPALATSSFGVTSKKVLQSTSCPASRFQRGFRAPRLREELVRIGARIVCHGRSVLQLADVAVPGLLEPRSCAARRLRQSTAPAT
jgi:hypothetical protein